MKLLLSALSIFILTSGFSQYLQFSEGLTGKYKSDQFKESINVMAPGEGSDEVEKEELFRVIYKKKNVDDQEYIFRQLKGSQNGEWYTSSNNKAFIRFTLKKDGQVIAEFGNDPNYDQIIDPFRVFNYSGKVATNELVKFNGVSNKDQINGNVGGVQSRESCEQEKVKLKEYFIDNDEVDVYETKGQRLYVIPQIYGDHETFKGILVKFDADGSNEKITHKVDIWYQPNKDEYGCAFQIFKCGQKTQLEKYTVLFNEDKSMITLNGNGFKKVDK